MRKIDDIHIPGKEERTKKKRQGLRHIDQPASARKIFTEMAKKISALNLGGKIGKASLALKDNLIVQIVAAVVIVSFSGFWLLGYVKSDEDDAMDGELSQMEDVDNESGLVGSERLRGRNGTRNVDIPDIVTEEDKRIAEAAKLKKKVVAKEAEPVMEYSFSLKMIVNGQLQALPADYGKTEEGVLIFSTDETNGDIIVKSMEEKEYTLDDFFLLWGGKFNSKCLFNHCLAGDQGSLTMTVNGVVNDEFEEYVIKPGDEIVIEYNGV